MSGGQSIMQRTARGTAWTFGGTQFTAALLLTSSIVFARAMPPSEIGRYAVVTGIVAVLGAASSLQSGGYYVVASKATPLLLRTGLVLELAMSVALFVLVVSGAAVYVVLTSDVEGGALLATAAAALLLNPFSDLAAFFQRELSYRIPTLVQTGALLVGVVVKIALALLGLGAWSLVAGDLVAGVGVAVAMLVFVPIGRRLAFDRGLAREQLAFGLPSLAAGLLNSLTQRVPEFALGALAGTREVGLFYLAARIPVQIYQLGRALSLALLPAFSRADDAQLARGFTVTLRLSSFIVGLPLAVGAPLGTALVVTLYGERWEPAGVVLGLLLAAYAVRFVYWHTGNLLKARGRVAAMAWLNAGQLGLMSVACVAGALTGEVWAVAVAILVVELLLVVPRLALIRSVVRFDAAAAFREPAVALLVSVVATTGALFLLPRLEALVVGTALAIAVFATSVWRSDRIWLQAMLGSVGRKPSLRAPRVLMVARLAPPRYSGAGLQAMRLGRELRKLGTDVTLLTTRQGWYPTSGEEGGLRVVRWPAASFSGRAEKAALSVGLVAHLLARPRRYGVIHLHGAPYLLRLLRLLKPVLGFRLLYKTTMCPGDDPESLRASWGTKIVGAVDTWACISDDIAEAGLRTGIAAERLLRISNGVDLDAFRPRPAERQRLRAELGLAAQRPIFIATGSFVRRKRLDLLISAWTHLEEPRPLLVLAGLARGHRDDWDEAYELELRASIDEFGLGDSVLFRELNDDIDRLLAASDGFVFASSREGLPNAVLEALATGLTVVTTAFGACGDIARLAAERLVVVGDDPRAFAAAVESVGARDATIPPGILSLDLRVIAEQYAAEYASLVTGPARSWQAAHA